MLAELCRILLKHLNGGIAHLCHVQSALCAIDSPDFVEVK